MKNIKKHLLKVSVAIAILCLVMPCKAQNKATIIEGIVSGIPDQNINLINGKQEIVQTTKIINGQFKFVENVKMPASIYSVSLEDKDFWVRSPQETNNPTGAFILADNAQHIKITLTVENPENPERSFSGHIFPKVTIYNPSPSLAIAKEFMKEIDDKFSIKSKNIEQKFDALNIDWSSIDIENQEKSLGEEKFKKLTLLREESKNLRQEKRAYLETYVSENSDNLKGLYALYEMGNTSILDPENEMMWPAFYNNLSDEIKNTGSGLAYGNGLERAKKVKAAKNNLVVGSPYINFSAPNESGEEIELDTLMQDGKYIFLDFWASWCGPCRAENPNVLKMYNKYHGKGLEVVAYSLDKSKNAWLKAIKDDGMPWIHVSDLNPNSQVTKDYGITGIPDNYLIDGSTGKIIARGLREKSLFNKLDELFNNK